MAVSSLTGMRTEFINGVLAMLQEGHVLRNLNLREVARRIGCAHTNVYNYFSSFEELIWYALGEALNRMIAMAGAVYDEEQQMLRIEDERNVIEAYIKFAVSHPAWYMLIWSEPLKGTPPEFVLRRASAPEQLLTDWLRSSTSGEFSEEELQMRSSILMSFLHGELAVIAAKRRSGDRRQLLNELFTRTNKLYELLT